MLARASSSVAPAALRTTPFWYAAVLSRGQHAVIGVFTGRILRPHGQLYQLAGYRLDWVLFPKGEELFSILGPRPLWHIHHHYSELRKQL